MISTSSISRLGAKLVAMTASIFLVASMSHGQDKGLLDKLKEKVRSKVTRTEVFFRVGDSGLACRANSIEDARQGVFDPKVPTKPSALGISIRSDGRTVDRVPLQIPAGGSCAELKAQLVDLKTNEPLLDQKTPGPATTAAIDQRDTAAMPPTQEQVTIPSGDANPGKSVSHNPIMFEQLDVIGLRVGMSESAAVQLLKKDNPDIVIDEMVAGVHRGDRQYRGGTTRYGVDAAKLADYMQWRKNGQPEYQMPYIKVGLAARPPGKVATSLIVIQTSVQTPGSQEESRVLAVSRSLLFSGEKRPTVKSLLDALIEKYGHPSVNWPQGAGDGRGSIYSWEFDAKGRWRDNPATRTYPVFGETVLLGWIDVRNQSPGLQAQIVSDPQEPVLAIELNVSYGDPTLTMRNNQERIRLTNSLINEWNSSLEEKAIGGASKQKPKL